MNLIAKESDIKINWQVYSALKGEAAAKLISYKYFPTFTVFIYDEEDNLIDTLHNLDNKNIKETLNLFEIPSLKMPSGRGIKATNGDIRFLKEKFSKKSIENYFTYGFLKNYEIFKIKNKSSGFYSKLKFKVQFNSDEPSYLNFSVEYPQINFDLYKIFSKIYRSNDLYSAKFLLDLENWNISEAYSMLIYPSTSNYQLSKIFIENVSSLWLNTTNESKLLTVPFVESALAENSKNIDLEIFLLNKVQSEIYTNLINIENDSNIKDIFIQKYKNQSIKISLEEQNKKVYFEGSLYLFNNLNFSSRSYPDSETLINGVNYKKYFPKLNTINGNTVLALRDFTKQRDQTFDLNLNEDLGYFHNNEYEDVSQDIPYFNYANIKSIEVIDAIESGENIKILVEFTTNIDKIPEALIDSSNLVLEDKYMKNINDIDYYSLIFSYSFQKNNLINYSNSQNIPLESIIYQKVPIKFSFILNLN